MSAPAVAGDDSGLVFNWEPPSRRKLSITAFIVASAALHALCFYVFQIVYPPTVTLLPPPARVNVINPNSEDGRLMLRWIEAEDPALASTTQRPPGARLFALPKSQHIPSYVTTSPALKELPAHQLDLSIPSSQPPGPVPTTRKAAPKKTGVTRTAVTFSPETNTLGSIAFPEMRFVASTNEPPQVAEFYVGASERGAVLYCLLRRSSGDASLDEQGRRYLLHCRFPGRPGVGGKEEIIWATATIAWGSDVTHPRGTTPGNSAP